MKRKQGADGSGGRRWTIKRLRVAESVVSAGVLALVAAAACSSVGAVLTDAKSTERTYQTLTTLSSLRSQLDDAQRGERGFVLTGDEHSLQPYTAAAAQMPRTLAELRRLVGSDARNRRMVDDLQASANATLDSLGQAITLLRTEGFRGTRTGVLGTTGDETLTRAEGLVESLRQGELTDLHALQQHTRQRTTTAVEMMTAAMLATAALIALKAWIKRSMPEPAPAVAEVETEIALPAEAEAHDAWHAPLRVLLAEDNQVNQEVAQFLLDKLGHRVDTVGNGLEAVQALRNAEYDVVLMDVQMPVLDGLEATRLIRAEFPADRQPHIIAMTASVLVEDRAACRAAGMNDYLQKPLRLPDLTSSLTPLLLLKMDAAAHEAETDEVVAEQPDVDREADVRDRLAEISDGEPSGSERLLLARLMTSFTAQTPAGLDKLAELITAGDLNGVRNQAHALNGSASNIGVTRLARLLAAVEGDARAGRLPNGPAKMAAIRAEYAASAPVCEHIADELTAGVRH